MLTNKRYSLAMLATILICFGLPALAQPHWTSLTHAAPGHLDTCLLLTDGSVMCHQYNSNKWHRLSPDIGGSYVNGTWNSPAISNMPNGTDTACPSGCQYRPLYFGSAVLDSGKVVIVGGEYNNLNPVWTNIGFMYNPVTDNWSPQLTVPFSAGTVGDAQVTVLRDGTLLLAQITSSNIASFNPGTNTFTALNPTGKLTGTRNDEEGWTELPNNRVLAVTAEAVGKSQLYNPNTNVWNPNAGRNTVVPLSDFSGGSCGTEEIGPAVVRPDGTVINFSGHQLGQNAVYDISADTWSHTASMDFPKIPAVTGPQYTTADAPASLLPNGNVLVQASPLFNGTSCGFFQPSHFFEWDGTTLTQVVDPPNASSLTSYQGRMLLLPSGEILFTGYDQVSVDVVQIYSNGGSPLNAWRPIITSAPTFLVPGTTYTISGQQFNGFSEGAAYGDDAQSSTNYPLVRITNNASGHVFYARTHNHNRMGVKFVGDTSPDNTKFDAPAALEPGPSKIEVVTNGIPSLAFDTAVNHPPVAIAHDVVVDADASCTNSTASIDNGSYDPDAGDTITLSQTPPGPYPVGTTNVTLTVTDNHGASSTATATVTVRRFTRINVNNTATQVGKKVTIKLTASVTSPCGSGAFTGNVTFTWSGTVNGSISVPIAANGTASYTLPTMNTPVNLNYSASYSGDATSAAVTSNVKNVQIF